MSRIWPCSGSSHPHLPSGWAASPPKCSACVSSLSLPPFVCRASLGKGQIMWLLCSEPFNGSHLSKAKPLPKLTRLNISMSSACFLTTSPSLSSSLYSVLLLPSLCMCRSFYLESSASSYLPGLCSISFRPLKTPPEKRGHP